MLSAAAALQQDCGKGAHDSITFGGAAGYSGSVSCNTFYGYTWWIVWYVFLLVVTIPILTGLDKIGNFRAGLLGLIALAVMLVGDTTNTYLYWNHLGLGSTALSRARTMVAGGIIASIAFYILILLIGFADEKGEKVETSGEPTGETYGGRYMAGPAMEGGGVGGGQAGRVVPT